MNSPEMALAWLAKANGLVRFCPSDGDERAHVRASLRLPWSEEDRLVSKVPVSDHDDPVRAAVIAISEIRTELEVRTARRVLRAV